jgi:hypothetical protein
MFDDIFVARARELMRTHTPEDARRIILSNTRMAPSLNWFRKRSTKPYVECDRCGEVTPRGGKYCSRECYAKRNSPPDHAKK